ncbi:hypothetical protein [Nitrosospira sp. NpAV]|uniref:hypothetical protein n=1 Tax=Nitrosospira sp. NpAV TaxID=58133 RepID=UPI00059F0DE3|nr:hypothetical protein [Nitrosospira sp. NpAV]KIO50363.1 hypothetical protein SQ11_01375 [Nitrosospira sp. NpAV]
MDAMTSKIRRLARRLGPAGLSGIVLLAATLVFLLAGVLPLRGEIDSLRMELAERPLQPLPVVPILPPDQILAKELALFQARFPTVDELSDGLDALFILARDNGLELNKGEYALVEKTAGALRRFEVTLPVTGTYSQIHGLILEVLEKLPSTALADIALERGKVGEGQAAVILRFVFFVRKRA